MLARARVKRLAAQDAFDLVWIRKENSVLLITVILSAWFSFRLRVICNRRVAEPSENSWLISDTAAFASTSIMDESCSSKVGPHGDIFINIFYPIVDNKKNLNTVTRYERSRRTRFERLRLITTCISYQQNLKWFANSRAQESSSREKSGCHGPIEWRSHALSGRVEKYEWVSIERK